MYVSLYGLTENVSLDTEAESSSSPAADWKRIFSTLLFLFLPVHGLLNLILLKKLPNKKPHFSSTVVPLL